MSTYRPEKIVCSICGAENEYPCLASLSSNGKPDLDLRPAETVRSTMPVWVNECPNCGYVSSEVSDKTSITIGFLKSPEFITCDGIPFASDLARKFYKYYKINMADHNSEDAFHAILHAAWACDDIHDSDNAKLCRLFSLPLIDRLIRETADDKDTYMLIKADLLRRTGKYNELVAGYSSVKFSDPLLNSILAFQIKRAQEHDPRCYSVSDVPKSMQQRLLSVFSIFRSRNQ